MTKEKLIEACKIYSQIEALEDAIKDCKTKNFEISMPWRVDDIGNLINRDVIVKRAKRQIVFLVKRNLKTVLKKLKTEFEEL